MFRTKDMDRRTNNFLFVKCLMLAAFALTALSASADVVVFDNGAPNQHGGNAMGDFVQGESFTLGSTTQLNGVNFWDLEAAGQFAGSINWYILADCGGAPCTFLAQGNAVGSHTATGLQDDSGFYDEYSNSFSISALLGAGNYWLFLHNGPVVGGGNDQFTDFYWEWTSLGGGPTGQEYDLIANTGYDGNGQEHAFQLTGVSDTPEPASLTLFGSGLMSLGFAARRRWLK